MLRASIVRAVMAVVAVLVAATAAATPASPATAEASIVPIIPIPASISPRAGSFIVQAGTPIYTSGDAEAARIVSPRVRPVVEWAAQVMNLPIG